MDDRKAIKEIQNGNKEYLNLLAEKYYDDIYRFCCCQTGDPDTAYDLAQETFLRFIRYVDHYRYKNLKGYLLTIARNVCFDFFSKETAAHRHLSYSSLDEAREEEPAAGLDPKERIRFRNIISTLGHDRIVLLSTHIVSDVANAAEKILIMHRGKIIENKEPACGCVSSLKNAPSLTPPGPFLTWRMLISTPLKTGRCSDMLFRNELYKICSRKILFMGALLGLLFLAADTLGL